MITHTWYQLFFYHGVTYIKLYRINEIFQYMIETEKLLKIESIIKGQIIIMVYLKLM